MQNFRKDDDHLALSKFESMLQSNKVYFFDSEEFEEIVYYYMDSGKINLAKKAIALSLTQHPSSISLKLIKVELLIFENKLKLAEKLLINLESIDPNYDEIFIQKAAVLSKMNNHKAAIIELKKALNLTDDLVDVHALLGMEYLFLDDFDVARKSFEFCLKEDLEDYAALYNIIYCYDMYDKNQEAILFLNNYIDENPYSEIAWHQLGRQYITIKKYDDALRAFDYAIIIDELFIGAYVEKANVLEIQKKYEEAISNYMITLELDDPTAFTYLQIATCYTKLQKDKMAIKYYHKSIVEDPMIDKAWLQLTYLYLKNENPQKALYFIEKALDVDAEKSSFLNRYAEINIKLNLFEEASKAFQKSITLGDKRLEIYIALVDVLHYLGEYEDALVILQEAKVSYPNTAEIIYRVSGLNYLLRKNNEAIFYFENALKLDYSYHTVIKNLYPTMYTNTQVQELLNKFTL